ncbi:MAG: hypothetical protein ACTSRA_13610, partial [Promethearchaeota archaeon]
ISIGYKHDFFGSRWEEIRISENIGDPNSNTCSAETLLPGPVLNCETIVLVSIVMKDGTMFSIMPRTFTSKTPWTYIIIPGIFLGLGLLLIAWYIRTRKKWRNLLNANNNTRSGPPKEKKNLKDKLIEKIHSFDKYDRMLVIRATFLVGCEVLVLYAWTLEWFGMGYNNPTFTLSVVDLIETDLYRALPIVEIITGVVGSFYLIALIVYPYLPKTAAFFNMILALVICIVVPIAVPFFLSNAPANGIVIELGPGAYLTLITCIAQMIFTFFYTKWKKKKVSPTLKSHFKRTLIKIKNKMVKSRTS